MIKRIYQLLLISFLFYGMVNMNMNKSLLIKSTRSIIIKNITNNFYKLKYHSDITTYHLSNMTLTHKTGILQRLYPNLKICVSVIVLQVFCMS